MSMEQSSFAFVGVAEALSFGSSSSAHSELIPAIICEGDISLEEVFLSVAALMLFAPAQSRRWAVTGRCSALQDARLAHRS
jgi:hypothetical protein